jgi:HD-GYP domain-containing protein (c-di-GMP phosphodiesterase class II)
MPGVENTVINMYDLLICLTDAGDLISHEVANHHQQVAYLAFRIAEQMGLPSDQQKDLILAGLLHDVGAFSLDERLTLIDDEPPHTNDHAFRGARLLEDFPPFYQASVIIRSHHIPCKNGEGLSFCGNEVPILSHILHLADRIAVLVNHDYNIIGQIKNIQDKILQYNNILFNPDAVKAFMEISINEYIWLDIDYKPLSYILPDILTFDTVVMDFENLIRLTKIFAKIIDFRSPFTANHSAGVAKTAEKLASLAGFSENECKMMLVAGNLHDLGKLSVSRDILNKPGSLDNDEFNIIRSHTFYTYRLLQSIKGFETISKWASFHHEKLNGKGYPFHLEGSNLPLGSKIMSVADVFTAITEDRPYRKGMSLEEAVEVLNSMVADSSLCPLVTSLLISNLELINEVRKRAQDDSRLEYDYFLESTKEVANKNQSPPQ